MIVMVYGSFMYFFQSRVRRCGSATIFLHLTVDGALCVYLKEMEISISTKPNDVCFAPDGIAAIGSPCGGKQKWGGREMGARTHADRNHRKTVPKRTEMVQKEQLRCRYSI